METQRTAVYRHNVFRTLSIGPARQGLHYTAKSNTRTNIFHGAIGLSTETGELLQVCESYILTGHLAHGAMGAVFEEMGDIGYYLMVLAKMLRVKVPAASKRVALKGTLAKGILDLNSHATMILSIAKKTLYGVAMLQVGETGYPGVDKISQAGADYTRSQLMKGHVEAALHTFWAVSRPLTGYAPEAIFGGNIAKLSARYGAGKFEHCAALAPHDAKQQQAIALSAVKK